MVQNASMTRLKDLRVGGILRGLVPGQSVTLRHVEMPSEDVAMVTYVDGEGKVEQALLYRDQESQLELVQTAPPCSPTKLLIAAVEFM